MLRRSFKFSDKEHSRTDKLVAKENQEPTITIKKYENIKYGFIRSTEKRRDVDKSRKLTFE